MRTDVLEQYALKSDSKQLPSDVFHNVYGNLGVVSPLYNPEALARILELNTYHYRCCRTKARETAGLGWKLKPREEENPSQEQYDRVVAFFEELPEPITSVLNKTMFDYESVGYGALELVRTDHKPDGEPVLLKHIPAHTIRIHSDMMRYVQMRGTRKRWFKSIELESDIDFESGQIREINSISPERRASEVMWLVNYTPRSDYYGLPDIIPALGAVHGDISRRDYNISFFDNYGVPAYAVFVTGNFDPGEEDEHGKTELEKAIEEHFQTLSKDPHSTLILTVPTRAGDDGDVQIQFKPLSVDVKEASFRLYRKDNRDEILSAHGVPPYRAGIAEVGSLSGNTAQESTEIYKRSIIEPRQETLETLINRYIVWGAFEATDWEFKLEEIDTRDEKHDLELAIKLFENAAITPNKLIENFGHKFGLEPSDDPLMDEFYLKGTPISQIAEQQEEDNEALMAMNNLHEQLIEIARKDRSYKSEED
ncbi:MAG: phage portal protein [Methanonatronarchaeia archaeon]|nr:MAG: phage portal protein [Methanonatronarchaeia archaeon]